jgi:hypothetical protein
MNSGRSGRGPTRLMSPRRTLRICGRAAEPDTLLAIEHRRSQLLQLDGDGGQNDDRERDDGEHRARNGSPIRPRGPRLRCANSDLTTHAVREPRQARARRVARGLAGRTVREKH